MYTTLYVADHAAIKTLALPLPFGGLVVLVGWLCLRVFVSCHHVCFNHGAAFPITNFQFATIHSLPLCVRYSPDILSKLLHHRNMLRTYGMPMHTSYLYRHNFLAEIFATPPRPPRALGLPCFLR